MTSQKQVLNDYNHLPCLTVSIIAETTAKTFPIFANIGVPMEVMGITTCEMSGFCHIFDDEDDPIDDQEGAQSDQENLDGERNATRSRRLFYSNISQCQQVRGFVSITDQTGQLTFFFPRATMHSCTRAKYFNKRFFSIPASCLLPDTLCQKLHLPPDTALAPQRCAILKKNSGYELRVLLTSAAR